MIGVTLYMPKAEISILMDAETVRISRQIFGKTFNKERSVLYVLSVQEVECYRSNNVPVYGVGLKFKDGKWFNFGSTLKEDEKNWILSEIYTFWKKSSAKSG